MKLNSHLRQNKKVYRHSIGKYRIPEPKRRTAKVYGVVITSVPEVKSLLMDIRKRFMIGVNDNGLEYELAEYEIDWETIPVSISKSVNVWSK